MRESKEKKKKQVEDFVEGIFCQREDLKISSYGLWGINYNGGETLK